MSKLGHAYEAYKNTMVRITVRTELGDLCTGSAFHIGDGWLATAAHVVNRGIIDEIVSEFEDRKLKYEEVIVHGNTKVDLAIVKTDFDSSLGRDNRIVIGEIEGLEVSNHVKIGTHFDHWLRDEFVLEKVLLMGYPSVPFSSGPVLLASEGEVNAVIAKYNGPHPHFIISNVGRGGFSGGPVISDGGYLLGVLTESLVADGKAEELGFTSAISVEPLLSLLGEHSIFPGNNKEPVEWCIENAEWVASIIGR